ncbi:MAG: FMN-binding negative transcriptional regulator [Microthrixaceae bacterium]|nr:FMN-binding negative transcriptional regulator [Microthrixaceae bacterium]
MYLPPSFEVESRAEIIEMLQRAPFGHCVTDGSGDGQARLASTPLPFVVDGDLTHVRAHVARANPHWRHIDGAEALLIVPGPDAYVSPRWYPSKADNARVVPTWNYEVVHLHGTIEVHDDPAWKRQVVADLTEHHEDIVIDPVRTEVWNVSDAPDDFVDRQLRAIVGVRLHITDVEAKRKLSQNKPMGDRIGAAEGLARSTRSRDVDTADRMRSTLE